ncbi:MAG: phosphoribosylamine--glycine ligase [Bdellovibrionales bacterium]|nr:phosphoribosylamine--glycine ligase [Bdellovibrionales bacterium]
MNLLIIGSGAREHALAWKLGQSQKVEQIYVIPGNPGMKSPKITPITEGKIENNYIQSFINKKNVNLTIIGPEGPLASGIVDYLEKLNIPVFGPTKDGAKLESSKIFAKKFMNEFEIPTAKYKVYHSYHHAIEGLKEWDISQGIVIKADQLAQGKGVVVTEKLTEAKETIWNFFENPNCKIKCSSILIEEKLIGKEVSAFAICDGTNFIPIGYACDYKRLKNNNLGPNTGGMGCYTPTNWPSSSQKKYIEQEVFFKVMNGMQKLNIPFKGILFAGLIINENSINVIEFNVRFGDPEAQVLMPIIKKDLLPYLQGSISGNLDTLDKKIVDDSLHAVHIVMTSDGYPTIDNTPMNLKNIISNKTNLNHDEQTHLFYSGVKLKGKNLVNSGGRVLGVTGISESFDEARIIAYKNINNITFNGSYFRTDIGIL